MIFKTILFAPLIGALIAGFGWRIIGDKGAQWVATGLLFLACLLSWVVFLDGAHHADPDRARAGAPLGSAKGPTRWLGKSDTKSEGRALRLAMRRVYDANLCDAVRIRSFASCVAITP